MPVEKRVVSVSGFEGLGTEVWELDAIDSGAEVHILIIPGNPGSAGQFAFDAPCTVIMSMSPTGESGQAQRKHSTCHEEHGYYTQFMRNMHQAFDGKAKITSLSSLGFHTFDSPLHKKHSTYNLQEQCSHKAAYLNQHILKAHSLPVVVMGHSIGLYMAMQAVHMCEGTLDCYSRQGNPYPTRYNDSQPFDELGNPRVIQITGLMPFIQTTCSNGVQRRLRALSHVPQLLAIVGTFLALLPSSIRAFIARAAGPEMDAECTQTTAALMRADSVQVAFTMAYHEFTNLDSEEGWKDTEHFAKRLRVLAGPNDPWWPSAHHKRAQKILDESSIELQQEQKHAFCTSAHCSALAAESSHRWIRTALDNRAAARDSLTARTAAMATRATSLGAFLAEIVLELGETVHRSDDSLRKALNSM